MKFTKNFTIWILNGENWTKIVIPGVIEAITVVAFIFGLPNPILWGTMVAVLL